MARFGSTLLTMVCAPSVLLALAFTSPIALAHFEIYSSDMESSFETSQNTMAPCSDGGYFSRPPRLDIGACNACQASIRKARKEVEDYPTLCQETRDIEAQTAAQNAATASGTPGAQLATQQNGGLVQSQGSQGEMQKNLRASRLADRARACQADIFCKGAIASEDSEAGKKVKKACGELEGGSGQVMNEKTTDSGQMQNLDGKDLGNAGHLDQLGQGPAFAANAADAAGLAANAGLALAGAGAAAAANGHTGSTAFGGGGPVSASVLGKQAAKMAANMTWDDYQKLSATSGAAAGSGAGGAGGNGLIALNAPGTYQGNAYGSASGAARKAPSKTDDSDSAPATPGYAITGDKSRSSSNPWLAYQSGDSSRVLAERLAKNPQLRKTLRDELAELLLEEAAHPGNASREEKIEYYRAALAEAELLLRQGSLDALSPMEAKEAFSMNDDETRKEVDRMLSGMGGDSAESPYSLFPRVHRALWRQIGAGKLRIGKSR